MKISTFIYGSLTFSFIMTILALAWVDFAGNYSKTIPSKYTANYDYSNETDSFGTSISDQVQGSQINELGQDIAIVKDLIAVAKQTKNSLTWIKDISNDLVTLLNIPKHFYYFIASLTILAISYAVIRMIFKIDA